MWSDIYLDDTAAPGLLHISCFNGWSCKYFTNVSQISMPYSIRKLFWVENYVNYTIKENHVIYTGTLLYVLILYKQPSRGVLQK